MRPVATRAIWYPDAILGVTRFVGVRVRVAEQLDDDDAPYIGTTRELKRRAAYDIGGILGQRVARETHSWTHGTKGNKKGYNASSQDADTMYGEEERSPTAKASADDR